MISKENPRLLVGPLTRIAIGNRLELAGTHQQLSSVRPLFFLAQLNKLVWKDQLLTKLQKRNGASG